MCGYALSLLIMKLIQVLLTYNLNIITFSNSPIMILPSLKSEHYVIVQFS